MQLLSPAAGCLFQPLSPPSLHINCLKFLLYPLIYGNDIEQISKPEVINTWSYLRRFWSRSHSSQTAEAFIPSCAAQGTPVLWGRRNNEYSHPFQGKGFDHWHELKVKELLSLEILMSAHVRLACTSKIECLFSFPQKAEFHLQSILSCKFKRFNSAMTPLLVLDMPATVPSH